MTDEIPTPDEITDPVAQPDALPEPADKADPDDSMPEWAAKLIAAVEALPDKVAASLPNPVAPDVPGLDDEAPTGKPWTHKGI